MVEQRRTGNGTLEHVVSTASGTQHSTPEAACRLSPRLLEGVCGTQEVAMVNSCLAMLHRSPLRMANDAYNHKYVGIAKPDSCFGCPNMISFGNEFYCQSLTKIEEYLNKNPPSIRETLDLAS